MINLTIVLYLLLTSHEITCLLAGVGFIDHERLRIGILSCDPTMHQSSSELRFWHHYWWSSHDYSLPRLNTTFPNERRKTRVTGHSVPTEKTICPFRNISRSTVSARRSRMSSTQPWRRKRPNRSRSWYALREPATNRNLNLAQYPVIMPRCTHFSDPLALTRITNPPATFFYILGKGFSGTFS